MERVAQTDSKGNYQIAALPVGVYRLQVLEKLIVTVNYMINGITLNNLTFSSISFQPSINTIQEFK